MNKTAAVQHVTAYLDHLCTKLPIEKTASLRVLQANLAMGFNLGTSIKAACPELSLTKQAQAMAALASGTAKHAAYKVVHHEEGKTEKYKGKSKDSSKEAKVAVPAAGSRGVIQKNSSEKKKLASRSKCVDRDLSKQSAIMLDPTRTAGIAKSIGGGLQNFGRNLAQTAASGVNKLDQYFNPPPPTPRQPAKRIGGSSQRVISQGGKIINRPPAITGGGI